MYIQTAQTVESSNCLSIVAETIGKLTIKVLDVQGWIAKKVVTEIEEGKQQFDLNINDLTQGIYTLNAFIGDVFVKSFRFVKE